MFISRDMQSLMQHNLVTIGDLEKSFHIIYVVGNNYFFLVVSEIKYEKIKPTMDGNTIDESNEFRFNIPATSDYFTR